MDVEIVGFGVGVFVVEEDPICRQKMEEKDPFEPRDNMEYNIVAEHGGFSIMIQQQVLVDPVANKEIEGPYRV